VVFSSRPGTPVSSTNKSDRQDITEILLKVALSTLILTPFTSALFFSVLVQFIFICLQRLEFLVTIGQTLSQKVAYLALIELRTHNISRDRSKYNDIS
jgi:hypothetical protein